MGSWSLTLILLLAAPSPLRAQAGSPRLMLSVPAITHAGVDAPTVSMADVLSEGHRRELLGAGWPTKLHCQVELYRRGWVFFDRESVVEWDFIVEYAPASRLYHVRRQQGSQVDDLGEVGSIEAAEQMVDRAFRVPLPPDRSGARYYYAFSLDVSTLSLSDLDAWQRWVRGDATPALKGKGNVFTAIQRGVGSMFSRALGGETQRYERRSAVFIAG